MAKKNKVGRPKGIKKVPLNLSISEIRAQKLAELAASQQKTKSILVENALRDQYGI